MHRPEQDELTERVTKASLDALEEQVARCGSESLGTLVWLAKLGREAANDLPCIDDALLGLPRPLGRFRLESLVGTGAYGAVFKAFDVQLARSVALKLAWPGVLVDAASSQRFADEPRAMAAVKHCGIVEVYDAGEIDLVGFISMEFVDGPTLAAWSKSQPSVSATKSATIIRAVAQAIEFAHRRGIVHRDLKPTNILMRQSRNADERLVEPIVTDFGLALQPRLSSRSTMTATCAVVGTDHYMSPEQAAGHNRDVGPRSDVFSLGVMLYELVARRRPFDGDTSDQVRQRIQEGEPSSIRCHGKTVPTDLETIIRKCLEKSPNERYGSAQSLADDLARFLSGQPIQARPIGLCRRGWKFARRNPLPVSLAGLAIVSGLAIAGLIGAWIDDRLTAANRIEAAEAVATVAEGIERQYQYAANIQHAVEALRRGGRREVIELLEDCRAVAREPVHRGIEWDLLWAQVNDFDATLDAHEGAVHRIRFTPQGDAIISAGKDGQVALWDIATMKRRFRWNDKIGEVNAAEPSADGSLVAIAGDDGRVVVRQLTDGRIVYDEAVVPGRVFVLAWLGSKTEFAVGGEDAVLHVIEPLSGAHRQTKPLSPLPPAIFTDPGHPIEISNLAYMPEHQTIAVFMKPTGIHVLDEVSLDPTKSSLAGLAAGGPFCYLPVGPGYFATFSKPSIRIQTVSDGAVVAEIPESRLPRMLVYSRGANSLVGAFRDGTIRTWDIESVLAHRRFGSRQFYAHSGHAYGADVSPDGRLLASGGQDGAIRLWHCRPLLTSFDVSIEMPAVIEFSPCGRWFAVVSRPVGPPGRITMFDAQTQAQLWKSEVRDPPEALRNVHSPQLQGRQIAFDPTGETAICLDTDFSIREYHAQSGRVIRQYSLPDRSPPVRIHLSPDGQFLLVVGAANDALVLNRTSGAVSDYIKEPSTICWGAFRTIHGDLWLESEPSRNILMKTAPSAPPLFTLRGSSGDAEALAVSRDGRYLAVGSGGRLIWFWDLQSGGPPGKCFGHEGTIDGLLFSADACTILSRSLDGTARLWHVPTRAELVKLGTPEEWIACMGLNPAGTLLVLGGLYDGHWGLQFHHLAPDRDALPKNVRPADAN